MTLTKPRIAVLRGGPSEEFSVSLKTGEAVLNSLKNKGFPTKNLVISKNNEWIEDGKVRSLDQAFSGVDLIFIALHGNYGEDGEVQKLLNYYKMPFTGSSSLASALAFNKKTTKNLLKNLDILMPRDFVVSREDLINFNTIIDEITETFGPNYIIKPLNSGSSFGMSLATSKTELKRFILNILNFYEEVLVEEYIQGHEATGAVLEDFRGEEIYTFPSIEISYPTSCNIFSNEAKYNSKETNFYCPSRFSLSERNQISEISKLVHDHLNLSQYSRSDFIVKDGKVYFLEVNTLPGLTKQSLFPKAAEAVGLDFDDLVLHLVNTTKN